MNKTQVANEQDEEIEARRKEVLKVLDRIFAELGVEPVDADEVELDVRPGETRAEAALRAIQESFAASGVSEEEFQESGRQIREELYQKYYGGE